MTQLESPLSIRTASQDDAGALARVHIRAWQQTYRGQVPDEYLDNLDWDFERRKQTWLTWITAAENLAVHVAEIDGSVVGFVVSGEAAEDESLGEVWAIYLLAEHWGRGIGLALHEVAMEHLRGTGFGEAVLWVLDTNLRTRHWYERQGWGVDGGTKQDTQRGFVLNELRYRIQL